MTKKKRASPPGDTPVASSHVPSAIKARVITLYNIIIAVILAITGLTCVFTPLGGDVRVFLASAKLADYYGSFPFNIDLSWEHKPLGNRFFTYFIYKLATAFSSFQEKMGFELTVKILYALLIFIVVLYFTLSLRDRIKKYPVSSYLFFAAILLSFYTLSYWCSQQVEDVCNLLVMVALPLAISKSRPLNFLSGAVLALLFTLKGITIFLSLYVFIALYFLGAGYRKNLLQSVVGLIISLAVILLSFAFIFPNALPDMLTAAQFQDAFGMSLIRIPEYLTCLFIAVPYIPVLLPGIVLTWSLLPFLIYSDKWKKYLDLYLYWLIGTVIIIVQGQFYSYHYLVYFLPSIYAIFVFYKVYPDLVKTLDTSNLVIFIAWTLLPVIYIYKLFSASTMDISLFILLLVSCLVYLAFVVISRTNDQLARYYKKHFMLLFILVMVIVWVLYQSFVAIGYPPDLNLKYTNNIAGTRTIESNFNTINNLFNLSSQPVILYLDNGYSAYYLGAPSYSRYYYNLPVERAPIYPNILNTKIYDESLGHILSYNEEFIILFPEWFQFDRQDARIKNKLVSEYIEVYNKSDFYFNSTLVIYRKKV